MEKYKFMIIYEDLNGNESKDIYTVEAENKEDAFEEMYDQVPMDWKLIQLIS